ncbi:MAG: hypothetical protein ABSB12_01530 [Candidatus Saccharimonadales bacterium]|jgi:hypothetical protein
MAKDDKSNYNEQRYFDIVPPNRKMPQSTSRPVIVTNHPEQSDPMVKSPPADIMEEKVDNDNDIKSPAEEVTTPVDMAIDSDNNNSAEADESLPAENDELVNNDVPAPEAEESETEKLLPEGNSNEPLLPANASPDAPTATVNLLQPTTKSYKWLWLVAIIVILLMAIIAGVSYVLLS